MTDQNPEIRRAGGSLGPQFGPKVREANLVSRVRFSHFIFTILAPPCPASRELFTCPVLVYFSRKILYESRKICVKNAFMLLGYSFESRPFSHEHVGSAMTIG